MVYTALNLHDLKNAFIEASNVKKYLFCLKNLQIPVEYQQLILKAEPKRPPFNNTAQRV